MTLGLFLTVARAQEPTPVPGAAGAARTPAAGADESASPATTPTPAGPKPFRSSSVLGSVLGKVAPSGETGQSGGGLMGADMLQMNMKMNMQFLSLQNAIQQASRNHQVHQNERCVRQAETFRIQGVGFDLDEREFTTRYPQARAATAAGAEDGTRAYMLDGFGKVDRLTARFVQGKLQALTAEWRAEDPAAKFEPMRKKLAIRLGPDESKLGLGEELAASGASSPAPAVTVWDFTDVAVDRRFELKADPGAKRVVLEVTAPSVAIDVGF